MFKITGKLLLTNDELEFSQSKLVLMNLVENNLLMQLEPVQLLFPYQWRNDFHHKCIRRFL